MEKSENNPASHYDLSPQRRYKSLVVGVATLSLLGAAEAPTLEKESPVTESINAQTDGPDKENQAETLKVEMPEEAPLEAEIRPGTSIDVVKRCVTEDTWEFTVKASDDSNDLDESGLQSRIAPHGGPDADSPEYNPDVIYQLNLEPGESKSVTVTSLPQIARYEWVDTGKNQLLAELNSSKVDFTKCKAETAPESPIETPEEPVESPEEAEPEPEMREEQPTETDATVEEEDEVDIPVGSAEPQKELPATGIGALALALGGSTMVAAGGSLVRRRKM